MNSDVRDKIRQQFRNLEREYAEPIETYLRRAQLLFCTTKNKFPLSCITEEEALCLCLSFFHNSDHKNEISAGAALTFEQLIDTLEIDDFMKNFKIMKDKGVFYRA